MSVYHIMTGFVAVPGSQMKICQICPTFLSHQEFLHFFLVQKSDCISGSYFITSIVHVNSMFLFSLNFVAWTW